MSKNRTHYNNYLKLHKLEFLKMKVDSVKQVFDAALELVSSGRSNFVQYSEVDMVYEKRSTKLGRFKKQLKEKDFSVLQKLYAQLKKGQYPNEPFQGMLLERLDKPEKPRMIKVPSVTDRIVYSMLLKKIEKFFDKDVLRYPIYGLTGKGVSLALENLVPLITEESIILKLDFQGYFDTIPRGKLLNVLRSYKIPGEDLTLIKSAINAPTTLPTKPESLAKRHAHKFKPYETEIGLPQGCAFSPLFASVYALDIERYLHQIGVRSIRYIDDIIIITKDSSDAWDIYSHLHGISKDLGLSLHEPKEGEINDKSYISKATGAIRFLGLDIQNGLVLIPEEKIKKFLQKLSKKSSEKLKNIEDIRYRDDVIVSFIRGWSRYYREHSNNWNDKKTKILEQALLVINVQALQTSAPRVQLALRSEFSR